MRRLVLFLTIMLVLASCQSPIRGPATLTASERATLIEKAQLYIGMDWKWGGQSFWWEEGGSVDCSGFVINAYKTGLEGTGKALPFEDSTVLAIWLEHCTATKDPLPGDLVFFCDGVDDTPTHIAIMISLDEDSVTVIDSTLIDNVVDGVSIRTYGRDDSKILAYARMDLVYE